MAEARRQPPKGGSAPDGGAEGDIEPLDVPTRQLPAVDPSAPRPDRSAVVRLFGSDDFFRLWFAQVVSALGDWLGFVAIVAIATRIGGASPAAAVSLVMSARLIPGFFLAPVAGVLVDRWDRKKVMVACDITRAATLATLPFVTTIWGLVVVSLVLEIATLLWSPAKEASVPNLVPKEHLTTANSLSLVAAYGTFPVATLLFALFAKLAEWLQGIQALEVLRITQESVAIYVDVVTFAASALMISTLAIPRRRRATTERRIDFGQAARELREGWHFMFLNPTVRAVMVAIGTGLIGGGMLVPLGDVFSRQVLGGGSAGFGLLLTALGFGMAAGVGVLSVFQRRIPKVGVFCGAIIAAGTALIAGAAVSTLTPALVFVSILGVCAGAIYVLGFTILHETVLDELRGRIFAALYTLVRFCLLLSFAVGPLLADRLGVLSDALLDGQVGIGGTTIALPGVRLALWFAAVVILAAGVLAIVSLRLSDEPDGEHRSGPA
ncbi:MAG TPA: MFS transporter [Acidimicrobiales bacterium]|nr:MFS transporter [Acidimicrobiales bacterium]